MLWIAGRHPPPLLPNPPLLQHLVRTFPLGPPAHHQPSLPSPLPVSQEPLLSVLDALQVDRAHLPRPALVPAGHHLSYRTTSSTTAGRSLVHHIPTICIPRLPSQHRMMPRLNSCKTRRDPQPSLVNSGVVWLRTLPRNKPSAADSTTPRIPTWWTITQPTSFERPDYSELRSRAKLSWQTPQSCLLVTPLGLQYGKLKTYVSRSGF